MLVVICCIPLPFVELTFYSPYFNEGNFDGKKTFVKIAVKYFTENVTKNATEPLYGEVKRRLSCVNEVEEKLSLVAGWYCCKLTSLETNLNFSVGARQHDANKNSRLHFASSLKAGHQLRTFERDCRVASLLQARLF